MRITAGKFKGRGLTPPKTPGVRPTSDKVRQAIFNILEHKDFGFDFAIAGARVLDLFAGTGAMGLEALSRGAERAVFVEADSDAARTINHNLDKLRLTGAQVVWRDVGRYLATETRTYDLIFVDPPYREYVALEPLLARYVPSLLADDGLLVLETSAKAEPQLPLTLRTDRRYGAARITLWHK
jgi:16S rRNA (guanine966-N2)-methyltransferase